MTAVTTLWDPNKGAVLASNLQGLGLAPGSLFYESFTDGIVAATPQTQAAATPLVSEINRITTCATAGNGLLLPPSAPGLSVMVINHAANPVQVYGAGTDTIDDQGAASGVAQMQGSVAFYMCATAGQWYSEGIGTGYAGSFQTMSSTDGIAAAGTNQATATPIKTMQNRFTTVTSGTGALLPVAVAGMNLVVINAGANPMQMYGTGSDTINGIAGATGVALAVGKTAEYFTTVAGAWHQLLSA